MSEYAGLSGEGSPEPGIGRSPRAAEVRSKQLFLARTEVESTAEYIPTAILDDLSLMEISAQGIDNPIDPASDRLI